MTTRTRVRAPELAGRGGWINTDRPLSLAELRGRIVLLDFWTFCCANCLHVIEELRPLEAEFADVLVVIGVHSPKFAHETEHDAVVAAVERYGVEHPVLDDPDLTTWQQYAVRAWPTLVLVDPAGYVVAQASGEGHAAGLAEVIRELVALHSDSLVRGPLPLSAESAPATPLRFPSKAIGTPYGLLVADTGHHQVVLLDDEGAVVRRFGSGARGRRDGIDADFAEPQGLCLLPGTDAVVVVADTANHALRGLSLTTGEVTTLAGSISSPWDVEWWQGKVAVAGAGTHQLWTWDPATRVVELLAGTAAEGLRDGPALEAWLAQPSGLSVGADGMLWFADAETSALRFLRDGVVETVVGQGLFDFGHRDGPAEDALFQHPLGVLARSDGTVVVCDTYNNAVRQYDPSTGLVTTLATGIAEPSGAVEIDGEVLVVASGAHTVVRLVAKDATVEGAAQQTKRPVLAIATGEVRLDVAFDPPPGQHLDESAGPARRLSVSGSPTTLLKDGSGATTDFERDLLIDGGVADGVLHVTAWAATCDDGGEHPACHLTTQDWGIPVRVVEGAPARIELMLRAVATEPALP